MVPMDNEILLSEYSYPEFKYIQDRIKRNFYLPWPISSKQTPISLSKAGFFYSGVGEVVIYLFTITAASIFTNGYKTTFQC